MGLIAAVLATNGRQCERRVTRSMYQADLEDTNGCSRRKSAGLPSALAWASCLAWLCRQMCGHPSCTRKGLWCWGNRQGPSWTESHWLKWRRLAHRCLPPMALTCSSLGLSPWHTWSHQGCSKLSSYNSCNFRRTKKIIMVLLLQHFLREMLEYLCILNCNSECFNIFW